MNAAHGDPGGRLLRGEPGARFEADDPDTLQRAEADELLGFDGLADDVPLQAAPAAESPRAGSRGLDAPLDDARLAAWIDAIVDHDERALSALYDATLSRVYGLVLRIVRRPAWAEEVVEDTYFQVWRQAARFDPARGRALTWLLSMARSRAIDALRREDRFVHDSLDTEDAPAVADATGLSPDELLDCARGHEMLHRALLNLGPQPRQLVALAFFRGLSHEEIAEQTALPLGTVKSQIRRSLITLREVLGDAGWQALPT
jgi:RNA polymerase sigma-70 factor (ECF subfamily)